MRSLAGERTASERASTAHDHLPAPLSSAIAGLPLSRLTSLWPIALAFAFVAAAAWVGLETGLIRLHGRWVSAYGYTHGYLVVGMSAFLLVTTLQQRPIPSPTPSLSGFVLLAAAVSSYALFELLDFTLGVQVMVPPILLGALTAVGGLTLGRQAMLPVGFLYFAIPVWDHMEWLLQEMTTATVTGALKLTDIPTHIDGHLVTTSNGSFQIVEACAGLRFFVGALTLAAFYGLMWYRRWSTRLLLLAATGVVTVLANWVRVYSLIVIGHVTEMEHYLIAEDHYLYGWLLLTAAMVPVYFFARWLEGREEGLAASSPQRRSGSTGAPASHWPSMLLSGILAAALVASPAYLRVGAEPPTVAKPIEAGITHPEWSGVSAASDWRPEYQAPYAEAHFGAERSGQAHVDVFVARYLQQQPDSKLVSTHNSLEGRWHRVAVRTREVAPEGERIRNVRELEITRDGERRIIWHWYHVGASMTHDRNAVKALEIWNLLRGRRDGAVVALSVPCEAGCDTARRHLEHFLIDNEAALRAAALDASVGER